MNSDLADRLLRVLGDVFPEQRGRLSLTTKAEDLPDWDSMKTIYLAMAVEGEFNVKLSPEEIAAMLSVPVILELLAARNPA